MIESYIYLSSVREFLRFKRLFVWILLAFAGFGLGVLWPHLSPGTSVEDNYSNVSNILVFHVLALASAIFTTAVVSQEVEQKTIVYLLTRPVMRWKLLLMRYLASVTVVAALGVFAACLASFGTYGVNFSNPLLGRDCFALVYGAFAYGALFLLVSLLFNRAMIICLLFAFGWETSVPNMPGEMYQLSVNSQMQAIASHPAASQGGGLSLLSGTLSTNTLTPSSAIVTLTILTVVLVAFGATWFTRFQYVPREDAE